MRIDHKAPEDCQGPLAADTTAAVMEQAQVWLETHQHISPVAAMRIASWWHSPSSVDVAVTAFASHGQVLPDVLPRKIRQILGREQLDHPMRVAMNALVSYVDEVARDMTRYRMMLSTGSGHRMTGTGTTDEDQCLTCGGIWQLMPDRKYDESGHYGAYFSIRGERAEECSGDTSRVHGYPGERYCENHDEDTADCACVSHNCNCIICD